MMMKESIIMAIKAKVNKRPFKNCKKLMMWKMNDEANEAYSSAALSFENRLTTYTDSVETNSTPLYGDGVQVETAVSEGSGSLRIGIHHVADEERVELYNETANSSGAVISTGEETPPYFCVSLAAEKRDGMLNLRKNFKVAFQKHEESVQQQENGGINYSMTTLNGTYSQNTRLKIKSVRVEVDPNTTEGQEFITNWYSNPEFIGGTSFTNTSVIKVGTTTILNGGSITSGDTVTFSGSAAGGSTPYTYSFYYRAAGSDSWTAKAEDTSTATADQTITVSATTNYEFRLVAKDANGISLTKLFTVTVEASS